MGAWRDEYQWSDECFVHDTDSGRNGRRRSVYSYGEQLSGVGYIFEREAFGGAACSGDYDAAGGSVSIRR
jgi:hypothetical protein